MLESAEEEEREDIWQKLRVAFMVASEPWRKNVKMFGKTCESLSCSRATLGGRT
jgi:hypothetical protein